MPEFLREQHHRLRARTPPIPATHHDRISDVDIPHRDHRLAKPQQLHRRTTRQPGRLPLRGLHQAQLVLDVATLHPPPGEFLAVDPVTPPRRQDGDIGCALHQATPNQNPTLVGVQCVEKFSDTTELTRQFPQNLRQRTFRRSGRLRQRRPQSDVANLPTRRRIVATTTGDGAGGIGRRRLRGRRSRQAMLSSVRRHVRRGRGRGVGLRRWSRRRGGGSSLLSRFGNRGDELVYGNDDVGLPGQAQPSYSAAEVPVGERIDIQFHDRVIGPELVRRRLDIDLAITQACPVHTLVVAHTPTDGFDRHVLGRTKVVERGEGLDHREDPTGFHRDRQLPVRRQQPDMGHRSDRGAELPRELRQFPNPEPDHPVRAVFHQVDTGRCHHRIVEHTLGQRRTVGALHGHPQHPVVPSTRYIHRHPNLAALHQCMPDHLDKHQTRVVDSLRGPIRQLSAEPIPRTRGCLVPAARTALRTHHQLRPCIPDGITFRWSTQQHLAGGGGVAFGFLVSLGCRCFSFSPEQFLAEFTGHFGVFGAEFGIVECPCRGILVPLGRVAEFRILDKPSSKCLHHCMLRRLTIDHRPVIGQPIDNRNALFNRTNTQIVVGVGQSPAEHSVRRVSLGCEVFEGEGYKVQQIGWTCERLQIDAGDRLDKRIRISFAALAFGLFIECRADDHGVNTVGPDRVTAEGQPVGTRQCGRACFVGTAAVAVDGVAVGLGDHRIRTFLRTGVDGGQMRQQQVDIVQQVEPVVIGRGHTVFG
ncbi:hypothetical protein [Nocardia sp. 2TAF39]|uniref:hypothetical protein n=1 Tax=Nocardia sp. 2TAF39 TaxID=3233017 RepID=UPI003F9A4DAC